MAEEVLRYRVEIDQADLSGQLAGIKNQVDTALGSMAFNSANSMHDTMINASVNFNNGLSTGATAIQNSFGRAGQLLSGGMDSARLGYQKFTGDLERAGLITPPEYARTFPFSDMAVRTYNTEQRGLIGSSLGGAFGIGYDYNMPITRKEYMDQQAQNAGMQLIDKGATALGIGGALVGFTAGAGSLAASIATPIGFAATAAWATTALAGVANYEAEAVDSFGALIESTSARNVKALSRTESKSAAKYIRDLTESSTTVRAQIGDATDVQELIGEGIAAGAFLNTGSVSEFKRRAKELVENFREIQHTMAVSGEEAMALIGGMTQSGLAKNVNDVKSMVGMAKAIGEDTGFTTKDMLAFAQQGAEMVRGTGLNMGKAGKEAMGLLQQIRSGYGTAYDEDVIMHVGGSQQAAMALQQMNLTYGNSLSGRVMSAAVYNGYDLGSQGTLGDMAMAAGKNIPTEPGAILKWQSDQREFRDKMTFERRQNMELAQLVGSFKAVGMDSFTKEQAIQKYINDGMSAPMAKLKVSSMLADPEERADQQIQMLIDSQANAGLDRIGKISSLTARAGIETRKWWKNTVARDAEDIVDWTKSVGNWWARTLGTDPLAGENRDFVNRVQAMDGVELYRTQKERYANASEADKAIMDEVSKEVMRVTGVKDKSSSTGYRAKTTIEMLEEVGSGSALTKNLSMSGYGWSNRAKDMKEARDALEYVGIDKDIAATVRYDDIYSITNRGEFRGKKLNTVQRRILNEKFDDNLIELSGDRSADSDLRSEVIGKGMESYRKTVEKNLIKNMDKNYKLDDDSWWGKRTDNGLLRAMNKDRVEKLQASFAMGDSETDQFAGRIVEHLIGSEGAKLSNMLIENPELAKKTFKENRAKIETLKKEQELAKKNGDKGLAKEYGEEIKGLELIVGVEEEMNSEAGKKLQEVYKVEAARLGEESIKLGRERAIKNSSELKKYGLDPDKLSLERLSQLGRFKDDVVFKDNKDRIFEILRDTKDTKGSLSGYFRDIDKKVDEEHKKDLEEYANYSNPEAQLALTKDQEGLGGTKNDTEVILRHIYDQLLIFNEKNDIPRQYEEVRGKSTGPIINMTSP